MDGIGKSGDEREPMPSGNARGDRTAGQSSTGPWRRRSFGLKLPARPILAITPHPGHPGEDVCPACNGTGKRYGETCTNCGGTGEVTKGIGGG